MKNICTSILLLAIVMSSFSFLFSPKVAEAKLNDKWEIPTVDVTAIGATTATIKYTLDVGDNSDSNIGHDIYNGRANVIGDGNEPGNGSDLAIAGESPGPWYYTKGTDATPIYEVLSGNTNDQEGDFADPENGSALGSYGKLECNAYGCGVYLDIAANTSENLGELQDEAPKITEAQVLGGTEVGNRAGHPIPGIVYEPEIGQSLVIVPNIFQSKQVLVIKVENLIPDTDYYVSGRLEEGGSIADIQNANCTLGGNMTYSAYRCDDDLVFHFKTGPVGTPEVDGVTGQTTESETDAGGSGSDNGPACFKMAAGIVPYLSIPGCFAQFLYWVWYKPTSFLAALAAMFLDWFMHFSIQSSTYSGSEFISQGWALVRDISNIVFIFILLYIAIGTILRLPSVDAKKMVATLVVVALLINFSLFFTKVVVDTSNILANLMYNTMSVGGAGGSGDSKPITEALVSQFNPQTLFSKSGVDSDNDVGMYIIVTIIAVIMNWLLIMMFLKLGILFVGRFISLMVAMILSPFAFISLIVPGMKGWKNVGWTNWSSELMKTAFLAPIFLFFLYLIVLFLDLKGLLAISDDASVGSKLLYIILPFAIVYVLLKKAETVAISLAGEIGTASMAVMNKVGGLAVGAATGGAALALRGTAGASMAKMAADPELQAKAAAGDKWAKMKLATANYGAASSFDFRKTKAGEAFGKQTGWDTNTKGAANFAQGAANMFGGKGKVDFSTEGGAKASDERKTKAKADETDAYMLKGYAADQQDKKASKWQADLEKALEAKREEHKEAGTVFDEVQYRKDFAAGNPSASVVYTDPKTGVTENIVASKKEKTSKEINAGRLHDQASEVEYGKGYVEKREKARALNPDGFNEQKWRDAENIKSKEKLSQSEKQFISDTRKKAGEENKTTSPKEKKKAEEQLNRANHELDKIDKDLVAIAKIWNEDPANIAAGNRIAEDGSDASFAHAEFASKDRQKKQNVSKAQLIKAQADLNDGTIGWEDFALVQDQHDKFEDEKKAFKTVFSDKATHQNTKAEASEKLSS